MKDLAIICLTVAVVLMLWTRHRKFQQAANRLSQKDNDAPKGAAAETRISERFEN